MNSLRPGDFARYNGQPSRIIYVIKDTARICVESKDKKILYLDVFVTELNQRKESTP